MLLIRPDRSASVPIAGLLLALLAAVLHAAYILLGRGGWGEVGDGAATFLIVRDRRRRARRDGGGDAASDRARARHQPRAHRTAPAAGGRAGRRGRPPAVPGWPAAHRATQTAVLSLCEPLAATLLAAVMLGQLLVPSQLLGGALLLGAGIAVQIVPARAARRARAGAARPVDAAEPGMTRPCWAARRSGGRPPAHQAGCGHHGFGAHQVSQPDRASA